MALVSPKNVTAPPGISLHKFTCIVNSIFSGVHKLLTLGDFHEKRFLQRMTLKQFVTYADFPCGLW